MTNDERPSTSQRVANRRDFLHTAATSAAVLAFGRLPAIPVFLTDDKAAVLGEIPKQHDATLALLREWMALPSIAAENRNYPAGPEHMARLARDSGFQHVELVPTSANHAGVFATLDAGAPT